MTVPARERDRSLTQVSGRGRGVIMPQARRTLLREKTGWTGSFGGPRGLTAMLGLGLSKPLSASAMLLVADLTCSWDMREIERGQW